MLLSAFMGRPPQAPPLEIYLTGGEYTFGYPGNSTTPQLPPIRSRVVIHGGGATVRFQPEAGALVPDWLQIGEGAELRLHHLTLAGHDGRLILNRGTLHLTDVRLTNDSGGPNYTLPDGGGIANYGTLTLTGAQLDHNRILTATTPGGAIWNAGTLTATCATFADNRASKGGAVWNAAGGQASFTKVKFAGNVANGGGAVFNADATHIVQITDGWWGGATPAFNDATQGTDTLGGLVSYTAAGSDPLAAPDCQSPPPETPPAGNTSLFSAASVPEVSSVQLPASIPPGGVARGKIAFMSNRNGNNDIYVMDANGANVVQVTNTANEWEYAPIWSPDGQKLIYKSSIGAGNGRWTIITPGTSAEPVWIDATTPSVEQASWFPNGQYLAFPRDGDLYRVQADGQNATKILDNDLPALRFGTGWVSTQIRSVAWSPTGTHIAFITHVVYHDGYDESYHLYVAEISAPPGMPPSPDLSSIRYITDIWSSEPLAPVWSPNGQEIALWKPDLIAFNVTSLQPRTLIYNPFYMPSGGQVRIYGWNWSRYDQTAFSVPDPTTYRRWIHLADPVGGALSQNGNTHSYSDYYPDFSPDACFGYESGGVCRIGQQQLRPGVVYINKHPEIATAGGVGLRTAPGSTLIARMLECSSATYGGTSQLYGGVPWHQLEYQQTPGWSLSANGGIPYLLDSYPAGCPTWTPSPTATVTVVPSPTVTGTPPTATPTSTDTDVESELSGYGIVLTAEPAMMWSTTEKAAIRDAVVDTARALHQLSAFQGSETPQQVFRKVITKSSTGTLTIRRINQSGGICQADNNTRTIICYGPSLLAPGTGQPLPLTKYTIVHELGHLFDDSSAQGGGDKLSDRVNKAYIGDCTVLLNNIAPRIMGESPDRGDENRFWTRGERGWGSGPARNGTSTTRRVTDFQQNAVLIEFQRDRTTIDSRFLADVPPPNGDTLGARSVRAEEAAADMFLNWVYRRNAEGPARSREEICNSQSSAWNGPAFLNLSWAGGLTAPISQSDVQKPGDARYQWMDTQMIAIFSQRGW